MKVYVLRTPVSLDRGNEKTTRGFPLFLALLPRFERINKFCSRAPTKLERSGQNAGRRGEKQQTCVERFADPFVYLALFETSHPTLPATDLSMHLGVSVFHVAMKKARGQGCHFRSSPFYFSPLQVDPGTCPPNHKRIMFAAVICSHRVQQVAAFRCAHKTLATRADKYSYSASKTPGSPAKQRAARGFLLEHYSAV